MAIAQQQAKPVIGVASEQIEDVDSAVANAADIQFCMEIVLASIRTHGTTAMFTKSAAEKESHLAKALDMITVADRLCKDIRTQIYAIDGVLDAVRGEEKAA